jgi:hypothetical protein
MNRDITCNGCGLGCRPRDWTTLCVVCPRCGALVRVPDPPEFPSLIPRTWAGYAAGGLYVIATFTLCFGVPMLLTANVWRWRYGGPLRPTAVLVFAAIASLALYAAACLFGQADQRPQVRGFLLLGGALAVSGAGTMLLFAWLVDTIASSPPDH